MRLFCISTITLLALGCSPKWSEDTEPEEAVDDAVADGDEDDDDGNVEDDDDSDDDDDDDEDEDDNDDDDATVA